MATPNPPVRSLATIAALEPTTCPGTVHLIDRDDSSRSATVRVLEKRGHDVLVYATTAAFLARMPADAGCIILDLDLSGLDAQQRILAADNPLPVVFLARYGDVSKSVRAMKAGAVDVLTRPFDPPALVEAVRLALVRDAQDRVIRTRRREARTRYENLTHRERDVFAHLISGQLNKQIGYDLCVSERTIKIHRRQVLAKMRADSIASLVRMAADLGVTPAGKVS